jgi:hypothetical protein
MTTSWAYAVRGRLADALRAHVGGTLLALAAATSSVSALVVAARGRWLVRQPSEVAIISLVAVAVALVLGEWIVRLSSG